uniref:Uncharacterized protein n=1 Tax=Timema tahoe TaxID=61484 RepID=A0A7R9IDS0_9NEOP|nr:unnamed protein product [Timema tahoe]
MRMSLKKCTRISGTVKAIPVCTRTRFERINVAYVDVATLYTMVKLRAVALLVMVVAAARCKDVLCPAACYCAQYQDAEDVIEVQCFEDLLTDVPCVDNVTDVIHFNASYNDIRRLPASSFQNFTALLTLSLTSDGIEEIDVSAFLGLDSLTFIDLSDNRLTSIHPETFLVTPHLQRINLGKNMLVTPTNSSILNVPSLKWLDLSSCRLTNLGVGSFSGLPLLETLDLSDNLLMTIPFGMARELPNHLNVYLGNNPWSCDSEGLLEFAVRVSLKIRPSEKLPCLDGSGADLINDVPPCLARCYCDRFVEGDVVFATCSRRRLVSIPDAIPNLSVRILDLSFNDLGVLKNHAFEGYPQVEELYLISCNITFIHEFVFTPLMSLKRILLIDNQLRFVYHTAFQSLSVRSVSLQGNPLGPALGQFPFLTSDSLQNLDLSGCGLEELSPSNLEDLPSLRNLSLRSNLLSYVSIDALRQSSRSLESVSLGENPWLCGEDFQKLLCWKIASGKHLVRDQPVGCLQSDGVWSPERCGSTGPSRDSLLRLDRVEEKVNSTMMTVVYVTLAIALVLLTVLGLAVLAFLSLYLRKHEDGKSHYERI